MTFRRFNLTGLCWSFMKKSAEARRSSPSPDVYLCPHRKKQVELHLNRIILTNFRNCEYLSLTFSPRLNFIVGLNGMGKTNLLDAVYYLCMGKSNSGGTDRNVVRKGADFFRIEGHFAKREKEVKVVAKVVPGQAKNLECDDVSYARLSDHVGKFPVVFKVPEDTALALDGSEERRRFLDNTLCQVDPRYLEDLQQYNRLLERRNAALKQMAETRQTDFTLLQVYEQKMKLPAEYILQRRLSLTEAFEPIFNRHFEAISGGSETVHIRFRSQLLVSGFESLLLEHRERDALLQRTTAGIHRDELVFHLNDLPLKRFASQGQLKSFVLALKLAQYDYLLQQKGVHPILLLDDLFDKLDDQRVSHLIRLLVEEDFGQVFITDTHTERSVEIAQHFGGDFIKFTIEKGTEVLTDP